MSEGYRTTSRPSGGGAFFSVEETTTRESATGAEYVRHVVRHPGGSAVVALIGRQAVCVRQYRPAVARTVLEVPAGRPEPGESPLQTARRELFEETGLVADQLDELGSFYNAPCFCDGLTRLFIATELTRDDVDVQHGEFATGRAGRHRRGRPARVRRHAR